MTRQRLLPSKAPRRLAALFAAAMAVVLACLAAGCAGAQNLTDAHADGHQCITGCDAGADGPAE